MLQYLYNNYITDNVFISGGIDPTNLSDYGKFSLKKDRASKNHSTNLSPAESFLTILGKALIDNGFKIYTGFGAGVGNYILSGVLSSKKTIVADVVDDKIHINSLMEKEDDLKHEIREKMIEQCSSMIMLFGYYKNFKQSGIYREYKLAEHTGTYIVPVEKTGFAARKIFNKLDKKNKISEDMLFLKKKIEMQEMVQGIVQLLIHYKDSKEKELRTNLFSSVASYGIKVFISYYYKCDYKIAQKIIKIINSDNSHFFTVVQEQVKKNDPESIKNWVNEEIKQTRFTILLISRDTLKRKYVSYEINKSRENGNTIIPVLIDTSKNDFKKKDIDKISKKLSISDNKKIKYWIKEDGEKNIMNWLNEALGIRL